MKGLNFHPDQYQDDCYLFTISSASHQRKKDEDKVKLTILLSRTSFSNSNIVGMITELVQSLWKTVWMFLKKQNKTII